MSNFVEVIFEKGDLKVQVIADVAMRSASAFMNDEAAAQAEEAAKTYDKIEAHDDLVASMKLAAIRNDFRDELLHAKEGWSVSSVEHFSE